MLIILGTILIVLATMGVGVLVDRRWSILPRKERMLAAQPTLALPGHVPGDAPVTAIDVTAGELEMLRRARCSACKGDTDALADDHVTFDGSELLVVHAKCRRCGRARSTYVRVRN
jgi:hypothetical protein